MKKKLSIPINGVRQRLHISFFAILLLLVYSVAGAEEKFYDFTVEPEFVSGVGKAKATLTFPLPLEKVYSILTNYEHWNKLLSGQTVGVDEKDPQNEHTRRITFTSSGMIGFLYPTKWTVFVFENCPHGFTVIMDAKAKNDFVRYSQAWKLKRNKEGHTEATFSMEYEDQRLGITAVAYIRPKKIPEKMKENLETHFNLIMAQVKNQLNN